MVVLMILAILTALAGSDLSNLQGRHRLNGAARALADQVTACRIRAIADNKECAIVLVDSDPSPGDGRWRDNAGRWEVRVPSPGANGTTAWSPIENEGIHDLHDGPDARTGISLEPWAPLIGPSNGAMPDAIVFSPRGIVTNRPPDFQAGVIRLVLRNKRASFVEQRVVRIDRGGNARIAQP